MLGLQPPFRSDIEAKSKMSSLGKVLKQRPTRHWNRCVDNKNAPPETAKTMYSIDLHPSWGVACEFVTDCSRVVLQDCLVVHGTFQQNLRKLSLDILSFANRRIIVATAVGDNAAAPALLLGTGDEEGTFQYLHYGGSAHCCSFHCKEKRPWRPSLRKDMIPKAA